VNRVLKSLIGLGLCLSACNSGPTQRVYLGRPPTVERLGPRIAALRTSMGQALEVVPRAGDRMGYSRHELRRDPSQVLLRTEIERAFFSMLGEQERYQEALVDLRAESGRVVIQVDAKLIHGPPGGPHLCKPRRESEWYDEFFDAVRSELDRLNLKASYAIPRD